MDRTTGSAHDAKASVSPGWHRSVGAQGHVIGAGRFGISAPEPTPMPVYEFCPGNGFPCALTLLEKKGV